MADLQRNEPKGHQEFVGGGGAKWLVGKRIWQLSRLLIRTQWSPLLGGVVDPRRRKFLMSQLLRWGRGRDKDGIIKHLCSFSSSYPYREQPRTLLNQRSTVRYTFSTNNIFFLEKRLFFFFFFLCGFYSPPPEDVHKHTFFSPLDGESREAGRVGYLGMISPPSQNGIPRRRPTRFVKRKKRRRERSAAESTRNHKLHM